MGQLKDNSSYWNLGKRDSAPEGFHLECFRSKDRPPLHFDSGDRDRQMSAVTEQFHEKIQ